MLREIRDEARQTNARLDQVVFRLEGLESTMGETAEQQRFVVRYVKELSERDQRLGDEVGDLRRRVEHLEQRLDPSSP